MCSGYTSNGIQYTRQRYTPGSLPTSVSSRLANVLRLEPIRLWPLFVGISIAAILLGGRAEEIQCA